MHPLSDVFSGKDHIIWDWNGTLLRDIDHAVEVVNLMLGENNLPLTDVERYKKLFRFPVIDYYRDLGFDTSPESFARLCERFNDLFYAGLDRCEIWPEMIPILEETKRAGKRQSVLSASEQNMLNHSVKKFGVGHLFDHVYGIGDKMAASKVSSGLRLMAETQSDPDRTILVGDTDHDVEVGEAMGIDVVLVEHGHQCAIRLRELHPHVVNVNGLNS